ncbi:DUF4328 domain-containing protein [Kitasatospora sp. NPDC049285]|uniref:DUF4328 domain-containing protein n=1 Tax=Kitasatospora sp. NPDC049285 TaxID=3157096 RepID=UPI0034405C78
MQHDVVQEPTVRPAPAWPVADPRALGTVAQLLIGFQTAVQVAIGLAGGTDSPYFAFTIPLTFPLFVATVAVFLVWFRRCRRNAEVLAPGAHAHTPGYAVGGWFIPLGNLWIPRRVALDIWRSAGPAGGTWIINAWWAVFLAKIVSGLVVLHLHPDADGSSPAELLTGVAAAALAILMIRRLTARQAATLHLPTTDSTPTATPTP